MSFDKEDDEVSFVQRHSGLVFVAIVLLVAPGIFYAARKLSSGHQAAARPQEIMMIRLPPPPPKPQPTPTPQQQPTPEQEQKMVEQPQVQDVKKIEPPKEKAPAPLNTSITGPGAGADLGLGSGPGEGGGYGSGGAGGSKYGWYASEVQTRIAEALRNNPRTRTASMNITVRVWPDASGRITKARLSGSTGDTALDATLQNDILTNMQLTDPPPADMPLPIVMRVSAQRPH
jgi:outer membrane biosynthesis protein TonB